MEPQSTSFIRVNFSVDFEVTFLTKISFIKVRTKTDKNTDQPVIWVFLSFSYRQIRSVQHPSELFGCPFWSWDEDFQVERLGSKTSYFRIVLPSFSSHHRMRPIQHSLVYPEALFFSFWDKDRQLGGPTTLQWGLPVIE